MTLKTCSRRTSRAVTEVDLTQPWSQGDSERTVKIAEAPGWDPKPGSDNYLLSPFSCHQEDSNPDGPDGQNKGYRGGLDADRF